MEQNLKDKKIAILATNGFEQSELFEPLEALKQEGATVHIVSPEKDEIKAWNKDNWGKTIKVDQQLRDAKAEDYNALVLPGGVINPDALRINEEALNFIRDFNRQAKPISAICHAPWLLISAGIVKDKKVTSYKSIKEDLVNAGANWVDESVVCENGLTTSRNPNDLPDFISKTIEEIKEGKHKS